MTFCKRGATGYENKLTVTCFRVGAMKGTGVRPAEAVAQGAIAQRDFTRHSQRLQCTRLRKRLTQAVCVHQLRFRLPSR